MSIQNKAVVVGCKVSPMKKKEVEQTAESLGVDVSTYLRAFLARDHPRLNYLSDYPTDLLFQGKEFQEITSLLKELQQIHPEYSSGQIMIAGLRALRASEKMLLKPFKIKKLIK